MINKYYLTKDKKGVFHLWLACTENDYCDKMNRNNYECEKNPFTKDEVLKKH